MNDDFKKFRSKIIAHAVIESVIAGLSAGLIVVAALLLPLTLTGITVSAGIYVGAGLGMFVIVGGLTFVLIRPTEKRIAQDGTRWVTEKPVSEKEYVSYLMDSDLSLHAVRKLKYRFGYKNTRLEIDVYPFSRERAVLFVYGSREELQLPEELNIIKEVTGDPAYKNRQLAMSQIL